MYWHPESLLLLAKQRQAEYRREAQYVALAERAARASGEASLISRLLAAWSRRAGFARASESVWNDPAPR